MSPEVAQGAEEVAGGAEGAAAGDSVDVEIQARLVLRYTIDPATAANVVGDDPARFAAAELDALRTGKVALSEILDSLVDAGFVVTVRRGDDDPVSTATEPGVGVDDDLVF